MTVGPQELIQAYGDGRVTAQRATIAEVARGTECAFSAADLATAVARADGRIGLATVYRALSALSASGWLTRAGEREGAALYVRCERSGHHHHLVCTECGRVEHTECPVEGIATSAGRTGFRVTAHDVTLYGLCAECDGKASGT